MVAVKKQTVKEAFLSSLRVKVTKRESDSRSMLCGEKMQIDGDGNEFFEIPAHQADYQKQIHNNYDFSDEYTIGNKPEKTEVVEVKKLRGNPNWRNKKVNTFSDGGGDSEGDNEDNE